jgi:hypothetical protein
VRILTGRPRDSCRAEGVQHKNKARLRFQIPSASRADLVGWHILAIAHEIPVEIIITGYRDTLHPLAGPSSLGVFPHPIREPRSPESTLSVPGAT